MVTRLAGLCALSLVGCAAAAAPSAPISPIASTPPLAAPAIEPPAAPRASEHWYFEHLSRDGKKALLRRLDGPSYGALQTRVVDVDSGKALAEDSFPELGSLPTATIGRRPNEMAALVGALASPAFGDDLVRSAAIAEAFPFGTCGRMSAAKGGSTIAFNAGDWLYLADKNGHVQKRLSTFADYEPRFTPDGKYLLFRRATGSLDKVAKYELFVVPADLSQPARVLTGTAGARDRFAVDEDGKSAVAVASHEPQVKTCVISVGLKPPFVVKRIACLDGGEPFIESILSPSGRWAAITTQSGDSAEPTFRLRVVATATGKIAFDEPATPGLVPRAISDSGLLVQSGTTGILVNDIPGQTRRALSITGEAADLGHRGFFRNSSELVVVRGATVGLLDLTKD